MTVHKDTASDNLVLAWSLRLPPAIYRHQRRFQAGTKQAGQDSYVPEGSQELCKQQLELVPKVGGHRRGLTGVHWKAHNCAPQHPGPHRLFGLPCSEKGLAECCLTNSMVRHEQVCHKVVGVD